MIQNRLPADLQERLVSNPFRYPNRYVSWNGVQLLAETVCKMCGEVLTSLGPDPRFEPRKRELLGMDQRTVILETLVSRLRSPYFETIEFEVEEPIDAFVPEGEETRDEVPPRRGLHRTAVCRDCKGRLLDGQHDLADVQMLYDADLERMAVEDDVNKLSETHTLEVLTKLASRKVTRIG